MGFWNFIYSIRDRVQGITPIVKRAGGTAYYYTSAAAAKIDQVVRVDGIQKLPQYLPDSETKAQIGIFTTKLAKNAGKYAVTEGFKHIPGATVVTKLISDTMREVKQETDKGGKKVKADRPEEDSRLSKSQPEIVGQNENLSLQYADQRGAKGYAAYSYSSAAAAKINQVVRVDGIKLPQYLPDSETRAQIGLFITKLGKNAGKTVVSEGFKHIPGATVATKLISDTMREVKQETSKDGMKAKVIRLEEDFHSSKSQLEIVSQNRHLILQNADKGANKAKDMINMFMVTEFVQNHMVRDIMISKIACKEKKNN